MTASRFRHSVVGGVYAVACLAALGVAGCARNSEVPAERVEQAQRPLLQESWDIVLNISEAGVPRLRLSAWHMERYDDPDSLFALFESNPDSSSGRVDAVFYDSVGVVNASMTAESVRFDEEGEHLVAVGDVRLKASSGRLLQAEVVHWDQAERQITVPGFVYLETEDEKIRGFDLVAEEDLESYAFRRITGTIVVREDDQ